MTNTPSNRPKKDDNNASLKDKFNDTLNNLKKNEQFDAVYQYAQENTRDTVAYIVLIVGILLIFFKPFWGGLLVGAVVGIYFYNEIIGVFQDLNGFIEAQGMVRSLILGGIAIAFFISAPMIFIGAALAVGAKYFIGSSSSAGH
jgi:CHASE3 domain sensor protein